MACVRLPVKIHYMPVMHEVCTSKNRMRYRLAECKQTSQLYIGVLTVSDD